jgi:hypothetical protein
MSLAINHPQSIEVLTLPHAEHVATFYNHKASEQIRYAELCKAVGAKSNMNQHQISAFTYAAIAKRTVCAFFQAIKNV